MYKLTVEVDADIQAALAVSAGQRHLPIEQIAAEVITMFVRGEDRPLGYAPWTAEDLAAIEEGLDQLDRGEFFTQEQVEARIDALLADG
jgi:predicted transcriptional regulator